MHMVGYVGGQVRAKLWLPTSLLGHCGQGGYTNFICLTNSNKDFKKNALPSDEIIPIFGKRRKITTFLWPNKHIFGRKDPYFFLNGFKDN